MTRSLVNSQGRVITYTAEGRRKDPRTWAKLDLQAWRDKAEKAGVKVDLGWSVSEIKRAITRKPASKPAKKATKTTKKGAAVAKVTGTVRKAGARAPGISATEQNPAVPPELEALAKQFGVDPSALMGGVDSSDPLVYVGSPTYPEDTMTGDPRKYTGSNTPGYGAFTKKSSDVLNDFYGLSPDELSKFQEQAFAAGLYGTADRSDIRWGDYDDDTYKIWGSMVNRAAGFYARGKPTTVWQAVDEAAKHPTAASGGKQVDRHTTSSNPAVLKEVISKAIFDSEGHKPDDARVNAYVQDYLAKERKHQEQEIAAGEAMSGNVEDIPTAQDYAVLRTKQEHPIDVQAHEIGSRADEFFNLLGPFGGL